MEMEMEMSLSVTGSITGGRRIRRGERRGIIGVVEIGLLGRVVRVFIGEVD